MNTNKNVSGIFCVVFSVFTLMSLSHGQTPKHDQTNRPNHNLEGAGPELGITADGTDVHSEIGVAALMPWANKLWIATYVSHGRGGGEKGVGLYSLDRKMNLEKHPESVAGTYANRMAHWPSGQAIVGPHLIDEKGNVRTLEKLTNYRLAAAMEHLGDPENKLYVLTMRGHIFEVDVHSLEVKQVAREPHGNHCKSAFTSGGKVIVADNVYEYENPENKGGFLAEWDGEDWEYISQNPFNEVNGIPDYGGTVFATGWDARSAILMVKNEDGWERYRLPKGSLTYDHPSNTEWMRIRQVESERLLMDLFGIFYELPTLSYDNKTWGIRPVSSHLHIIPDFVSWNGMLIMGSDLEEHDQDEEDGEPYVGQPTAGLWTLKIDDLWEWGKPEGWGAVWREDDLEAGEVSDPFLMTGFEHKMVHLSNEGNQNVKFTIEVDILGNGTWKTYRSFDLKAGEYRPYEFPSGFSAHWVRLRVDRACKATANFVYH